MQIDRIDQGCPACGAASLQGAAVLHHMLCAYIGPEYDFTPLVDGYGCPKCRRGIAFGDATCEIVGTCARCNECWREMVVSPGGESITRASGSAT